MKRCSASCVLGELQIKTRYHYTPIRMAQIQNSGKEVEQEELSLLPMEIQNGIGISEGSLAVSYKTKHTSTI